MPTSTPLDHPDATTPVFLMSPPRGDWGLKGKANFRSREASATDAALAQKEWARLADAIVAAGGEVIVCPADPEQNLTGMIYTAEAGEFYRTSAGEPAWLLPTMAAPHRRPEADWIARFVEGLGFMTQRVKTVWEAQGDCIRAGDASSIAHTFGAGPEARTEEGAYAEVAERLSPRHLQIPFRADPWFHGNTFLNVFRAPEGDRRLMVVCPEAMDAEAYARLCEFVSGAEVHEISTEQSRGYDTNALQVGRTVLAPTTLSAGTEAAILELGLRVEKLDLGELFLKGGGAPVCLTNRLWGLDVAEVPERVRWSVRPRIEAHRPDDP